MCRCRPAAAWSVTSSDSGRSVLREPKSTITGNAAIVPASTARSTGAHSGPEKCAVLMPTMTPGYRRAMSAVGCASMSSRSCSNFPPRMPLPTMFRNASTRVVGAIDDALLEVLEVAPARSAGVDDRRDARSRRHDIRIHAVVARIGALLSSSRVHVRVNVDESGRDEQPARIDRLRRIRRIDLRRDHGNLAAGDRHVPNAADVVSRIDDMPAAASAGHISGRIAWQREQATSQAIASDSRDSDDDVLRLSISIRFSFRFSLFRYLRLRRPLRAEVFPHVEIARHLIARRGSGERERQRVSACRRSCCAGARRCR